MIQETADDLRKLYDRSITIWLYSGERCHQGIGNRPIDGVPKPSDGAVLPHERLGGILSHYYRQAA